MITIEIKKDNSYLGTGNFMVTFYGIEKEKKYIIDYAECIDKKEATELITEILREQL